jgi:integrase
VSEALAMRWSDLDLERGAARLDKNRTDDPRA